MSKGTEFVDSRPKIRTQTQTSSLALTFLIILPPASSLLCPLKSFLLLPAPLKPCLLLGAALPDWQGLAGPRGLAPLARLEA
mgnify:CR=1 FL=1